jgi:uncharacterized membrane protein YdjX (TVP38/TMEM64 family)
MSAAPSVQRAVRPRSRRRRPTIGDWARVAFPVVILAGLVVAAWQLGYFDLKKPDALDEAAQRASGIPWLAPTFVAVYAGMAALAAPVSPLAYGAGAVFGFVEGSILVWVASMLGSAAGYTLARTVWSESALRLLGRHEKKLQKLREGNTFLTVLRLQLVPVIPFGMLNYAAGTARLRFLPYWLASGLGIIPLTLAAVYVGDRLRAGVRGSGARAFIIGGAVMVGMLLLSLLPTLIAKRNERRSNEATPEAPPSGRRESLGAPARSTRPPQR